MEIVSVHATYKKMELAELERWTRLDSGFLAKRMESIGVSEYVVLKTCNRLEVYAAVASAESAKLGFSALAASIGAHGVFFLDGKDSIRHLMRVCAGLDSMVVGEQEIQRQVKEAFGAAQKAGTCGKTLNYVFMKALSASKSVREKTRVAKGIASMPQAAAKILVAREDVKNVCVLGTGRMARGVLECLKGSKLEVTVSGRDARRTKALADLFSASYIELSKLDPAAFESIVTAVSSPKPVLRMARPAARPKIVIDLGNPRNVDARGVADYIGMEQLKGYICRNVELREKDISQANRIIDEHLGYAVKKLRFMDAEDVISRIYVSAESARKAERDKAIKIIGGAHSGTVDDLTRSLANNILAGHVGRIKRIIDEGDPERIAMLKEIYGVNANEVRE
jgi:glutamyl-tRNA reductase